MGGLTAVIAPHYPKPEGAGRRPVGIERMLGMHFFQHRFNLSDPAVTGALYESHSMCRFVGIDLGRESVPDGTTVLKFRHILEAHHMGDEELFRLINAYLGKPGLKVGTGTIMDVTIIIAPSWAKSREEARDSEMHQMKKGNQWYFGIKTHIEVDSQMRLIHTHRATAANEHDRARSLVSCCTAGGARMGRFALAGQRERMRAAAPRASDNTNRRERRGHPFDDAERECNPTKSKVRAKVKHPFHVISVICRLRVEQCVPEPATIADDDVGKMRLKCTVDIEKSYPQHKQGPQKQAKVRPSCDANVTRIKCTNLNLL